jgi:hypothetical protein
MSGIEEAIVGLVGARGPLTGFEIQKEIRTDSLLLWRACRTSGRLEVRSVGTRYMRLDRHVDGFARLSPSILREFLTYCVVGLPGDRAALDARCLALGDRIREISRLKFDRALRMVLDVMEEYEDAAEMAGRICFIIAGDIVYNMAHDVPRPERSTGKLVKGSDIDLVVVTDDDVADGPIGRLDELIYRRKYRMLIDPAVNEEVDYKIKRLMRVREQAAFDDFKRMVAVKILDEGVFLHGSEEIFRAVKDIIRERGLDGRLAELEARAHVFRSRAEMSILDGRLNGEKIKETHLFYSAEEFEEFE